MEHGEYLMEEIIVGNIAESNIIDYEEKRKNLERIYHDYKDSLISLGFNPEGKDLLESITFLANTLNNVMCTLEYHKRRNN